MQSLTLNYNGISYALPPKTLTVARKLEEFSKYDKKLAAGELSVSAAAKQQHDFIIYCLGEQSAIDLLGSSDIEKIDVDELLNLSLEIIRVYSENAIKARSRAVIDQFHDILNDPKIAQLITACAVSAQTSDSVMTQSQH